MLTIPNYQTSLTPFTLTEKTTIPLSQVKYILELNGKELHDETLLFLTGDTSLNVDRYNYYPINLTPYDLIGGQYSYKVWQTTGNTLSITGLTTNDVVETGFATITTTGATQNPTYVAPANTQTQYIFE
jgi:hypothetical protein